MRTIRHIGHSLTHLFFPELCYGCGSDLVTQGQLLCLHCLHQLPFTDFHLHAGNPVERIFWGRLQTVRAAGMFYLTKESVMERLIYQLKYKGKKEVGIYFGNTIGRAIAETAFNDADALVPLPLHPVKEKKRGYNQSALICEGIASVMHKPVWKHAVERVTGTQTQTRKNRIERWENMQGRFNVRNAAAMAGTHVLLVDDVITTGATLEACGNVMADAGAKVSVLTVGFAASGTA